MLAHQILAPLAHELCDLLPDRPSVRENEVLYVRAALIGRLHDAEDSRPVPAARPEVRIQRIAAEVGVDRESIRKRHSVGSRWGNLPVPPDPLHWSAIADRRLRRRLQKRRRVCPGRRADVAALRISDHLQPGGTRVGADLLERTDAVRAQRLEERRLGLDRDHVRSDCVDEPTTEAGARVGRCLPPQVGVALQLDREQIRARVEADDELRALPLDRVREPVGEVRRRDGRHPSSAYWRRKTTKAASCGPRRNPGGAWALAARTSAAVAHSSAAVAHAAGAAGLDGRLQLAPRGKLRHRGRRDRHLLARVAWIHALALGAPLGRELPETGKRHVLAALQRLGNRVEEGVDRLRCVASREPRFRRNLVNELLFRQVPLLLSTVATTGKDPNRRVGLAQPCGFAGVFAASRISLARKIGRSRTARRSSASAPPSSRSTTHTAVWTMSPASRRASTASRRAPPEVTTSSITHTQSPSSKAPSTRFAVP